MLGPSEKTLAQCPHCDEVFTGADAGTQLHNHGVIVHPDKTYNAPGQGDRRRGAAHKAAVVSRQGEPTTTALLAGDTNS